MYRSSVRIFIFCFFGWCSWWASSFCGARGTLKIDTEFVRLCMASKARSPGRSVPGVDGGVAGGTTGVSMVIGGRRGI